MTGNLTQSSRASDDSRFNKPYIDIDEWRESAVRYHYIHGGFEGTDARFSFFFPDASDYKGRFFQFMAPVQGSENAAIGRAGTEDKIAFAVTHGAYFVETNMGVTEPFVPVTDPKIIEHASAASAEYSRVVAQQLFGEHRPFGYIYGGSGGGYKTMICFENNDAWDGAVPYVIGMPMSIPYNFTARAHARRILRHKMAGIADAVDAGGSGDLTAGLDDEEKAALEEVTRMGFPTRCWFMHEYLDDGSLPVLTPNIDRMDPGYYQDFWEVPGYLGADPAGSAVRDRIQYETTIVDSFVPGIDQGAKSDNGKTGVDEAWQRVRGYPLFSEKPWISLAQMPADDAYIYATTLTVLSGGAKGLSVPLDALRDSKISIGPGFGIPNMLEELQKIKSGDRVRLDNSDYLALQTYHRHQVPAEGFEPWDQFRDENGQPIYPQRPRIIGTNLSTSGCSTVQSGKFDGKMIVVSSLMDEAAFPSNADWYRRKVAEMTGGTESDYFRLWYTDHSLHGDLENMGAEHHIVNYLGTLHQALLDVSDWVERGIAPPASTVYTVQDGQVETPDHAKERLGVQPTVRLLANGGKRAQVKPGETARLSAAAALPPGTGRLVSARWNFEGEAGFPVEGQFENMSEDGCEATINAEHTYAKPGTYFAVCRVQASRDGTSDDPFTQIFELDRVRIVVEQA